MTVKVCDVSDVPDGSSRPITVMIAGRPMSLAVFRRGGSFHIYRNLCPHASRPMEAGDTFLITPEDRLVCAAHGAVFNISDGVCIAGPCAGFSLQAVKTEMRAGALWII